MVKSSFKRKNFVLKVESIQLQKMEGLEERILWLGEKRNKDLVKLHIERPTLQDKIDANKAK